MKIVIIEDEPDTAEMYAEMMRISGYEVVKYYGGLSAVAHLADQEPDAVILDLMMPDLSGLEVLNYIKEKPDLSDLPVIIVSAKTMPEDVEKGLKAGAVAYLTKPVSFADLRVAIDDAVSNSSEKLGIS
ncbi:MAG: response regulator transcription factor [Anaerolineales bacterium]|nr:response regulator transcription factor [Anaerolineales bacterium]